MSIDIIVPDAINGRDQLGMLTLQFNALKKPRGYTSLVGAMEDLTPWFKEPSLGSVLAHVDDNFAGYVLYRPFDENQRNESYPFKLAHRIHDGDECFFKPGSYRSCYTGVHPDFRGRGVGSALWGRVLEEAKARGAPRIYVPAWMGGGNGPIKFFSSLGFTNLHTISKAYEDDSSMTVFMKDL